MRLRPIVSLACFLVSFAVLATADDSISLDGQWDFCQTRTGKAPAKNAQWRPIEIPSFVRMSRNLPFLWCRRSFRAPAAFRGRRLFLRFNAVKFVSTVSLNGREIGGHYGGWEPFEIDVTDAIQFDRPNDLLVRVRDVTGVIDQPMDATKTRSGERFISRAKDSVMAPVGSQYYSFGIWQPVSLVARNAVYVEDVFVQTSVREKRITVEVTLRHLGGDPCAAQVAAAVRGAQVALGAAEVKLPSRGSFRVSLDTRWEHPRLWEPEDPHLYHLLTTVRVAGKTVDTRDTRFGFREFWTDGPYLVLNGVRMNFLATAGHPRGQIGKELGKAAAIDFFKRIREAGCVAMRLHANVWPEAWYQAADEVGMPVIMESAFFCYSRSYALSKPRFWANYRRHMHDIVVAKRNHPAIVMYSLENEILHCGGDRVPGTEHQLAEAGRFLKRLDPTRPILYDADADPEGVADVVNLHYPQNFNQRNLWPDVDYWLETGMKVSGWPRKFWKWNRKKPLYFGEFLHIQHFTEADPYSVLLGDEAYLGHDHAMAKAKAIAWAMQIEAYRADEVSGMCPWTLTETGPFPSPTNVRYLAVKRGYQKNAAFVREYDTRFYERETVPRTVYVYNDTLHPAKLTFEWALAQGGRVIDEGRRELDAQPAQRFELPVTLRMPAASKRTPLTWTLCVLNGGKRAFEESKRYWVFPRRRVRAPAGLRVAVFERDGRVVRWLTDAGGRVERIKRLGNLPEANALIIGPHALDALAPKSNEFTVGDESAPGQALAAFARRGGTVIVLEQNAYGGGVLPAHLVDRGCTIAFQRSRDAGLFRGLGADDFKFWRGGHVVCHKTIAKPAAGRFRALVDSGGPRGLAYLALCEIREGRGRFLLSQLAVGEKMGKEPVAQIVLENLLAAAAHKLPVAKSLAVVQERLPLAEQLAQLGARVDNISGRLGEANLQPYAGVLVEADAKEVARHQAALKAYVHAGGRVVLHRSSSKALANLRALFPESIAAQSSNALPVTIAAWDPAIDGLTNQELYWYGERKGLSWRVRTPLSPAVCRYVIVAGRPDPRQSTTVEAETMAPAFGSPRISKTYVYMGAKAAIKKAVRFPADGEYAIAVRGRGTPLGGIFPQVSISLDGQPVGSITTDGEQWGSYTVYARARKGPHELQLAFVNDAWAPEKNEDRNVWLDRVVFGPIPTLRSKRLLSPTALVKVPLGKGFYLLDQVQWSDTEGQNDSKASRYICNLLTNLNVAFAPAAGATVIAGNQLKPAEGARRYRVSGDVLRLGTNATFYAAVRFGKTRRYAFAVRARGTEAGGAFPNIDLSLDGKKAASLTLHRSGWRVLRAEAKVKAGTHQVALSFTNDFYRPPEDRNLEIAELRIR